MFTGVKGVGKSTIVAKIASELNLPYADYADFMLEEMTIKDKDSIELLSHLERSKIILKIRKLLEQKFILNTDERIFILENHLTTIDNSEINIPDIDIYWRFNLAAICVMYANPQEIIERRKLDKNRNRPNEDESFIINQQLENKTQAELIANKYNIPLKFICNDNCYTSIKEIIEWIKIIKLLKNGTILL
jgi:adenylate kinase